MGLTNNWMCGIAVDVMDEKIILNTWKWFDELLKADPKLSAGTYVLTEVMQPVGYSTFKYIPQSTTVTHNLPGSISFDPIDF
jgi:hypothetical protein